jgi:two-component system, NtrC family, sensor kinase
MVQAEKMSSLGQLVAGIAHEINNPVNFIHGNIDHAEEYTQDLLDLITLYQAESPQPSDAIATKLETIDLDFLRQDLRKLLTSMPIGTERIREIVKSLRLFSRLDESEVKPVNIHDGIDSTLTILQHRLKAQTVRVAGTEYHRAEIQIIKEYSNLPEVECFAGQLNQVFMNILANAIDALEERDRMRSLTEQKQNPSTIGIITEITAERQVSIRIIDNGIGIPSHIKERIFDPFFTTKPVGKGTGMGMSISYQIVIEKHRGQLFCHSTPDQGTEFVIQIPIQQHHRDRLP